MSIVLNGLLQSKSIKAVVKDWLAFAQSNEEDVRNQAMLQFFIHVMHRQYQLTELDVQEIGNDVEFSKTTIRIYRSDTCDSDEALMMDTVQAFVESLVDESFAHNLLHPAITIWTQFLYRVVTNAHIPKNVKFRGRAIHLASLFLSPLCCIQKTIQSSREELDISVHFAQAITNGIDVIMKLVPLGFEFVLFSEEISSIFATAMESCSDVLITETTNYLHIYLNMLSLEVHSLQANALKSLRKLCFIPSIRPLLVKFMFEGQLEGHYEDSFMDVMQDLFGHKSLQLNIVQLLKAMAKLQVDHGFFTDEMRAEIYSNVFARSRNLVKAVAELMEIFGDDFWIQAIKLLSTNIGDNVNLQSFITTVLSVEEVDCDPNIIPKIVLSHLDAHNVVLQQAAVILVELMRSADDEQKMLVMLGLNELLENCLSDEDTFMHALKIVDVDFEMLTKVYKENADKFIVTVHLLSSGFDKFESPTSLHNIVATLKKLYKLQSEHVIREVRELFGKYYVKYMDLVASETDFPTAAETQSVVKLSILLEERSWNVIPIQRMEFFFDLNKTMLSRLNHSLASICIRLHTNFLKHLWTRMVLEKPLPFGDEQLAEGIEDFLHKLGNILGQEELEELHYPLCSFMDLCVCFQPSMRDDHSHAIFKLWSFSLQAATFKELAGIVEHQVFQKSEASNCVDFHQAMILQSWINLCRNYKKMPSSTASHAIIAHYSLKSPFKSDLERLMKALLSPENGDVFAKTVAISILDLSNHGDSSTQRTLIHAIEQFLRQQFASNADKRLSVLVAICSFVLPKLGKNIASNEKAEDENRLKVLESISMITKLVPKALKQKLEGCIPKSLAESDLTDGERNRLSAFVASLRE